MKEIKPLSYKQQLDVMTKAYDEYKSFKLHKLWYDNYVPGICSLLEKIINDEYANRRININDIRRYIPIFTHDNMCILGRKGLIPMPRYESNYYGFDPYHNYWWPLDDIDQNVDYRGQVFTYLIEELTKKVNDEKEQIG